MTTFSAKNILMLLGSGELGKEIVISAKKLGKTVVAVDKYANAPAMQVADHCEVIDMLSEKQLEQVVAKYQPHFIVPEIEAIRTSKLKDFEERGITVVPTAQATHLTMNRDAIRDVASMELGLKTASYAYASSLQELRAVVHNLGFPCVVKPVMSSSGKGQSVVLSKDRISSAWELAIQEMRGDRKKVIAEEWVAFDLEITLLTVKQQQKRTIFLPPIGHCQRGGDYQESWMPAQMDQIPLQKARKMAKKVTDRLGGSGLFGVEFFITKQDVYFSEISPRPHDTGLVTLISQDLSEFDLHVRAILGLPIPTINHFGPSASAVIFAHKDKKTTPTYIGMEKALSLKNSDVRIFGKPNMRPSRRMAVALARGASTQQARKLAKKVAGLVEVQ